MPTEGILGGLTGITGFPSGGSLGEEIANGITVAGAVAGDFVTPGGNFFGDFQGGPNDLPLFGGFVIRPIDQPSQVQFDYRYLVLITCNQSKCLPIPPKPPLNWGSMDLMQAEYDACNAPSTLSQCFPTAEYNTEYQNLQKCWQSKCLPATAYAPPNAENLSLIRQEQAVCNQANSACPTPPPPPPTQAQFDYRYSVVVGCFKAKCLAIPAKPPLSWGSMALMQAQFNACNAASTLTQCKPVEPPSPRKASLVDQAIELINRLKKFAFWVRIVRCMQYAEPLFVVECLEALIFEQVLGLIVEGILKALNAILRLLSKPQWEHVKDVTHIERKKTMACADTHLVSNKSQGPGVCCAALKASGQTAAVGVRVAARTRTGKCFVCEVTTSRSAKKPGVLVFKRGHACAGGQCLCPSSTGGCCQLAAA